jgi:hypothetical protein
MLVAMTLHGPQRTAIRGAGFYSDHLTTGIILQGAHIFDTTTPCVSL